MLGEWTAAVPKSGQSDRGAVMTTDPEAVRRLQDVRDTIRARVEVEYKHWAHDRNELIGEVMEKYFKKWGRGPGPDNLHAWLKPVIRNAGIDIHDHAAKREDAGPLEDEDGVAEGLRTMFGVKGTSLQPVRDAVWTQAFDLIPEKNRRILKMVYYNGMPAHEIAEELGKSVAAANKAIQRARKSFRDALELQPELADELKRPHPKVY